MKHPYKIAENYITSFGVIIFCSDDTEHIKCVYDTLRKNWLAPNNMMVSVEKLKKELFEKYENKMHLLK
jgi:predicted metal-binding transcription factor (methanogenesis marker protein 9)